jgi:hypothetical protein
MGLDITSWFRRNRTDLVYERTLDDNNWYFIDDNEKWSVDESNLQYALRHPILTPALLFLSNLFAQARFHVVDKKTKEVIEGHPLTKLLEDPNFYQSRIDFKESAQFLKIAQGRVGIWKKRIPGFNEIDQLYLLRSDLITFPEGYQTKHIFSKSREDLGKQIITYDKENLNIKIPLKDIVWLFDLPNVSNKKNFFENESRITGLHQVLRNTLDTQLAKNIIIKTNGKEMISGDNGGGQSFPFGGDEQKAARQIFNDQLGLGFNRSRLWMTKAKVTHKNLTVAMRDLGHDESTKVDGNIIYTALHIPKDILSLEAKKTTYNNFKESLTSFIQNDMQAQANDFGEAFKDELEDNEELVASFEHLPVMQFIEIEKYTAIQGRAKALNDLLKTGVPDEDALDLCGFPKNMKLNERQDLTAAGATASSNQSGGSQENDGATE